MSSASRHCPTFNSNVNDRSRGGQMNFLHVQMDTGQQTASVVRTNRPALRHHRRALPRKRLDERRGRDALLDAVQEFGERVVRTGGPHVKEIFTGPSPEQRRSSLRYAPAHRLALTSSSSDNAQPPCSNPPRMSSPRRPGACITPHLGGHDYLAHARSFQKKHRACLAPPHANGRRAGTHAGGDAGTDFSNREQRSGLA